jgi:hypothetical protein
MHIYMLRFALQLNQYIYKYVYKGYDCAIVSITSNDNSSMKQHDEVASYLEARCVSAPKAMWRLLENKMHDSSHNRYSTAGHNRYSHQAVYFMPGNEERALLKHGLN